MTRVKSILSGVVLFLASGLFGITQSNSETILPQYAEDIHLGVTSCAGSTCHGAASPWEGSTVLQNEYVTWSQSDKHSKAYSVLLNDDSKRIALNLGLPNAHEAKICLDCHADNTAKKNRGRVFQIADGVGCEACHGGAQRWLGLHVAGIGSHQDNIDAGLFPTEDPVKRAELCLSCHFGDDKKFVTHRIMGAGHPRMSFELDTFTAIQPAHYLIDDDYKKRKIVANGIQTWAIGQAIALGRRLDATLDQNRNHDGIFPELVLFDCQACHHSLTAPRWQARPSTGLGPGIVRFDDSNLLMLQIIVSNLDSEKGARLAAETKTLHKAVTQDLKSFHSAAESLKRTTSDLVEMLASHQFGKADVVNLVNSLLKQAKSAEFSDYAGAEQAVMAISAIMSTASNMGMGQEAEAAKAPIENALAALAKYDDWDYAGFKAAIESIQPIQ